MVRCNPGPLPPRTAYWVLLEYERANQLLVTVSPEFAISRRLAPDRDRLGNESVHGPDISTHHGRSQ